MKATRLQKTKNARDNERTSNTLTHFLFFLKNVRVQCLVWQKSSCHSVRTDLHGVDSVLDN